jgi:competence protein ComEA
MKKHHLDNSQSHGGPKWLSWLQQWERSLLVILIVGMLGMVASLLWPKPQAVISLKPYANSLPQTSEIQAGSSDATPAEAQSSPEEANTATDAEDTEASSSKPQVKAHKKRSSGHPHSPKKSDHPPITNLNTAKLQQLELLPGIGPKMGERVIEYRKANGGFKTVEQIMDVKGIGPKKFEKMKPFLKV